MKRVGTRAETRFGLSAKRTSPFKLAGGQFSRLLAAEVCASAVVMVVMLDTPCSEVECKTTGYPLHSHVSPSLPLPCVTVCHQVSTELYQVRRNTQFPFSGRRTVQCSYSQWYIATDGSLTRPVSQPGVEPVFLELMTRYLRDAVV